MIKERGLFMKTPRLLSVVLTGFLTMTYCGLAFADHVDMKVRFQVQGGTPKVSNGTDDWVNICGTYPFDDGNNQGTITIENMSGTPCTNKSNSARVEVVNNATSGDYEDRIQLRNAKITTDTAFTDVKMKFWATVDEPVMGTTVHFEARGEGTMKKGNRGAINSKLIFRGYIENPLGAPQLIDPPLTNPPAAVPCSEKLVKCVTSSSSTAGNFYWASFAVEDDFSILPDNPPNEDFEDRMLRGEFWLTLAAPSHRLELPDDDKKGLHVGCTTFPGASGPGG